MLRERYKVKVGYSGHETGRIVSTAAVALGATSIERHEDCIDAEIIVLLYPMQMHTILFFSPYSTHQLCHILLFQTQDLLFVLFVLSPKVILDNFMLTNMELLQTVAEERKYTFIATGMSTYNEIDEAIEIFLCF